jgi:predicted flap endonuclease-1-like 5' DNA nuclease/archaellum component FlaC
MDGFLWLLLQMTLLLLAAAVVFFMLGWRWRGQNAKREVAALDARIDAESALLKAAQDQRDAALSNDQMLRATQTKIESDLQEANDHRRNLERDLIRVHEELKSAKRDADQRGEDLTAARSALSPLQTEVSTLKAQLEVMRREQTRLQEALLQQPAEALSSAPIIAAPVAEPSEKIKKPKVAAPKKAAASAKPAADAEATLARLAAEITTQQTLLTALRQELDDWQRRVSRLREKGNDPAGLGLANKSLTRSETQVAEASNSLDKLQRQQKALRHCLEQASTITQDDDLTKIKGIKGVLNTQLHAYGIRSFQQIANWTESDVETFSELLAFKDRAKRDQWVQQAQTLLKENQA